MKEITLDELHQISLDILTDVHQFCIEHKILYTLFGGTMIGAIRHKGFIPWDDDVDIAMPRPDYERFISSYQSRKGYSLEYYEKGGCELAFARVCDSQNTVMFQTLPWADHDTGVSIDIFPLDGAPDNFQEAKRFFKKTYWAWNLQKLNRVSKRKIRKDMKPSLIINILIRKILFRNPITRNVNWVKRHVKICKSIPFGETKHFANLSFMEYGMREYQLIEDFQSTLLVPFEGKEYCVCNGYDRLMRTKYGNYMALPPESKRTRKHGGASAFWKQSQ